jgi:protease-4
LSSAAGAQQSPTAATEAPGESFALQDDGASLSGNPGGLGFVDGLEADFLSNGYHSESSGRGHGLALHLSGGSGQLALGFGLDWLRRDSGLFHRRASFGAGLRLGVLGLGAVHRRFSGDVQGLSTWDFGLLARPTSWLSFGAAALDRYADVPRRYRLALGLRPVGELADLAVDLRWRECTNALPPCGIEHYDLLFTLGVQLVRGVRLIGQLGFLDKAGTTTGLVGVQLDFPHAGVTYGPRFGNAGVESLVRERLSSQPWPGLRLPIRRAALIDLEKSLQQKKPSLWSLIFPETRHDALALTIATIDRLGRDGSVRAVVFRAADLPIGLGKAEELRAAIERLQARGKRVIFYLESAGDLEYSLASSADRIYSAPQAILTVNGFSATALFAAAGLDKLGVKAEFFRVGAYKNAPDVFTRSGMSGEQREVEDALLDDLFGRYVQRVSEKRRLEVGKLKALLDKGILKPQEALEAGLLDGLVYPDQLEEEVGKLLGGKVALEKISTDPPVVRETQWGPRPRITVVRVEGNILRGEGERGPFGAVKVAGSEPIARRIRRAADDPGVKAIVVRIDSPGGDGTASDLIWRELVRARKEKKKPVIASMGDVAASGGYYVAAGADEIWAEPSTITGSIGVFIGHFDAQELYGKLGLSLVTMKRGESADIFSTTRELTDKERRDLQIWVENFYDQFLGRVAEARRLSKEQVHANAQGRVWTGAQALERNLIDRFGGLEDAVRAAKKRAGLDEDARVDLDDEIEARIDLEDVASPSGTLASWPIAGRALRALQLLGEPGTVRAALPYDLEVR